MTSDRRKRIETLFHEALEKPVAQRSAFLDAVCGDDTGLRGEVQSLLEHDRTDDFLDGSASVTPGTQLGNYEILSLLGRGGMGEVWRAKDTTLGRQVAIKTLPEAFSRDPEFLARFEREARLLASLNHPNIAVIHGLEQSGEVRFIVLELIEGETLEEVLETAPLPIESALKIALQIAEALEAAHERGVIHRDLKPANIKVTEDGRVKVLDFGLAKVFAGERAEANPSDSPTFSVTATRAGVILGTAAYMSPEQAKGRRLDQRADVWAFGAILYEMLARRQAFDGEEVSEILASVLAREPDYTWLRTHLTPRVQWLVRRCLEKEPSRRWQSIGDVRIQIEDVLGDPDGAAARVSEAVQPSSRRIGTLGLTALGGILVAAVATWNLKPEPPSPPGPVIRFAVSLPAGQTLPLGPSLAVAPGGADIVYTANGQLYRRSLDANDPRPVPGVSGTIYEMVISPDGESVIYATGPPSARVLQRIELGGGTPRPILTESALVPVDLSWDRQDTILFVDVESGGIFQMPAVGGTPQPLADPEDVEVLGSPQLLPDGSVLFAASREDGSDRWDAASIWIQPPGGQGRRIILDDGGGNLRYVPTGHLLFGEENRLFAVPFDLASGQVMGDRVPVAEGIRRPFPPGVYGTSDYGVSETGDGLLAYAAEARAGSAVRLAIVDEAGAMMPPLDLPADYYGHPRVSPDGHRLVYQVVRVDGRGEIWTYEMDGASAPQPLTGDGNNTRPIWRDDTHVAYASDRDGSWRIYLHSIADNTIQTLTEGAADVVQWPESWSPDGQVLCYTQGDTSRMIDVRVLSLEDREPRVVHAGWSYGCAFSPDGNWIAHAINAGVRGGDSNGGIELYRLDNGNRWRITETPGWPTWSANGRRLYARRGIELFAMDISFGARPVSANERRLPIESYTDAFGDGLSASHYDPFEVDGRDRFVMTVPADPSSGTAAPPEEIRFIHNFFEVLKDLAPAR